MKRILVVTIAAVMAGSCGFDRASDERQTSELACAQDASFVRCCKRKFPPGKARGQCVAEAAHGRGVCAHPVDHDGGGGSGGGGAGGGGSGGGGAGGHGGGTAQDGGLPDADAGSAADSAGSTDAGTDTSRDAGLDTGADAGALDAGSDSPPPVNHCPTITFARAPERVPIGGTLTVTATIFDPDPIDMPMAAWFPTWPGNVTVTPFSFMAGPVPNPAPPTLTATVTCLNPTVGAQLGLLVRDNLSPSGCAVTALTEVCAPWCGDGRTTAPEQCDPPNGSSCDDQCRRIAVCGDAITTPPETCDPPNGTSCDNQCRRIGACGDGVVQRPVESCEAPTAFCQNCQLTTCGGCFYSVGGGAGVCDGLSVEDTISCNNIVSCTSPGFVHCAFVAGPNVAPGILGCYCSDVTCTAPGPCGTGFEALAHSHDPAEVIRQINDPTTPVGRVAAVMLRFGTSSCGRSCSGL